MPDNLTRAQRSYCMSRVKGKNTSLESQVASLLRKRGLRFGRHAQTLPGRPDIVFKTAQVAVFVDGDFWHGYRFNQWSANLKPFWKKKIEGNIARDRRNFSKLRRQGWKVVRVWGHSVKKNPDNVAEQIESVVTAALSEKSSLNSRTAMSRRQL